MAKLTELQIERKVHQFTADVRRATIRKDQQDRAEINQDMVRGGKHMWTREEWDQYSSKGVTPISINRCKPVLKGLMGMYLDSKQEIKVKPRRGGSATVAQVHSELVKHTQDVSYADYMYSQVFMRGGIDTEAYLKLEIDYGENPAGQAKIVPKSLWEVDVDRNALEYDLNVSAKYVVERDWRDKDEVNAMYPEHSDSTDGGTGRLKSGFGSLDPLDQRLAERLAVYMTSDSGSAEEDLDENNTVVDYDVLRDYRYLLRKVYWKEVFPELHVYDKQGKKPPAVITDEKKIVNIKRKSKKSIRFAVHSIPRKVLHETVMLGSVLIEDNEEPLGKGITDYPIVRFAPMWDEGYAMGVLDDIVSLNREENIHRTQTIRILNQTANSGWTVGTDANKQYVGILKNYGSVEGIVLPRDKFGNHLEKIKPNPLPIGHFTLGAQFETDVKRVSGVDDASQGYETGKADSGRALGIKIKTNRQANEVYFDNFYRTLEIFGNMMLRVQMVNDHYTDDEIKAIVTESAMLDPKLIARARFQLTSKLGGVDLPEPQPLPPVDPTVFASPQLGSQERISMMADIKAGAQGAQQYAKAYPQLNETWEGVIKAQAADMLLTELRADKGLYGVKVTIAPSSPTERMSQFVQMDALMSKYGQIIPVDVFIDLMDIPQKEEIKARIMAAQQAQPQGGPIPTGGIAA